MSGVYRYASVVQLTMDDPVNEDLAEGDVLLIAGRCEDGIAHTVMSEEAEGFVDVECEVLTRLHSESRMTKDEIESWAASQPEAKEAAAEAM